MSFIQCLRNGRCVLIEESIEEFSKFHCLDHELRPMKLYATLTARKKINPRLPGKQKTKN